MTELALWEGEARKYGMHYGDYVAAVKNELLPPPKRPKAKANVATELQKRTCSVCGIEFEAAILANGRKSTRTLCMTCYINRRSRKKDKPMTDGYTTHTRGR